MHKDSNDNELNSVNKYSNHTDDKEHKDKKLLNYKNTNESESLEIKPNNNNKEALINNEENYNDFENNRNSNTSDGGLERNFFQRTFGKMHEGSVRASIFSLICFVMGTGCLTMPYSYNKMALVPGIIFTIIGGASSLWSLQLLVYASEITGIRGYKELVEKVLGKTYSKVVDWVILVYQSLLLIAFTVSVYQIIANILFVFHFRYHGNWESFDAFFKGGLVSQLYFRFSVLFGLGIFVIVPLCLMKDLSKLKVFSLLGIFLILYNVIILVVLSPNYINHNIKNDVEFNYFDTSKDGFTDKLLFFPAFANIFYSLNGSVGAFPIYNQLKDRTERRINKVFTRAIVIMTVILIIIGVVGYLSVPNNTTILIIFRDTLDVNDLDIFLTIGKIMYVGSLIVTIANNFIVTRMSYLSVIYGDNAELTQKRNYLITLPIMFFVLLISSLYQEISSYLSIIGGYLGVISLYILPVWLYIKVNPYDRYNWRNFLSIFCGGSLTLMGFIGGTVSLVNIFRN